MPQGDDLVMSNEEMQSTLASEGADLDDGGDESSQLDYDGDVESTWADDESGQDSDDAETDASATEGSQTIREIKANGKVHEVNMDDQEAVDHLLSLGLGARQVFTERDKLKKTVQAKDAEVAGLKKYKDLWDKLESSKHDRAGLYEKIWGEKFEAAIDREVQRRERWANATPEERRYIEYQQKLEEQQRKLDEQNRQWEERQKEVDTKSEQADLKELRSQLLPEFYKYEFSGKVKDAGRAEKLNAALWKMTVSNLKQYGDNLTPEQIRREFRNTAELLTGSAAETAKTQVKQITEKKKQVAKQQASVAATRNYKTSDVSKLAQEKDPVKLFRKMFGR